MPRELREHYRASGAWTDDTFAAFLAREATASADLPFRVWSQEHPFSGTVGGLYGTVASVEDKVVILRLADNLKVRVAKSAVAGLEGQEGESQ